MTISDSGEGTWRKPDVKNNFWGYCWEDVEVYLFPHHENCCDWSVAWNDPEIKKFYLGHYSLEEAKQRALMVWRNVWIVTYNTTPPM